MLYEQGRLLGIDAHHSRREREKEDGEEGVEEQWHLLNQVDNIVMV